MQVEVDWHHWRLVCTCVGYLLGWKDRKVFHGKPHLCRRGENVSTQKAHTNKSHVLTKIRESKGPNLKVFHDNKKHTSTSIITNIQQILKPTELQKSSKTHLKKNIYQTLSNIIKHGQKLANINKNPSKYPQKS